MPHDARVRHTVARSAEANVPPDARGVGEEQQQPSCRILWFLNLTMHRTGGRRRGKRRRRRRSSSSSSSSISRRLPSMTQHGKS
jgi:hypothetical protein